MEATKVQSPSQHISYWITILASSLGVRSIIPFLELFLGILMAEGGHVTDALRWSPSTKHWTSHYKWVQNGKWSWLSLVRAKIKIVIKALEDIGEVLVVAIIDDTVIYRSSGKAPGARMHYEHSKKINRSEYVLGQGIVSLSIVVRNGTRWRSLPLLHRLSRIEGNSSKLTGAQALLRVLRFPLKRMSKCLLLDSWYMRESVITYAHKSGWKVIGQVRSDTVLYQQPKEQKVKKRGRPRKYGQRISLDSLCRTRQGFLFLYGKERVVEYYSEVVRARFLHGQKVRAVWVRFHNEHKGTTPWKVILSTDITLSPRQILLHYEKRWATEPMFNQLKNTFCLKEAWQQTRQAYLRWIHLLSAGYFLKELMASCYPDAADELSTHSPWWNPKEKTPSMLREGMRRIFGGLTVRDLFDRKSKKFTLPDDDDKRTFKLAA